MIKVALTCLSLLCLCSEAQALCERYPSISIKDEYRQALMVGTVRVVNRMIVVDEKQDPSGYEAEFFDIEVETLLKGARRKFIKIYNLNTSARFPMTVGEKYFVFVRFDGDVNYIDSCGNSDELAKNRSIEKQVRRLKYANSRSPTVRHP